jgi:hypothetical protein
MSRSGQRAQPSARGEGLRLLVSGKDIVRPGSPLGHDDANSGTHTILTGGDHNSHLVLPVIPPRK